MTQFKILAIADADSRLKWAQSLAHGLFKAHGCSSVKYSTYNEFNSHTDKALNAYVSKGISRWDNLSSDSLEARYPAICEFDFIIVALRASHIREFIETMARCYKSQQPIKRPLLITGYWGLVFQEYMEGLFWRLGADVICVNSQVDQEKFRPLVEMLEEPLQQSLVVSGLLNWQMKPLKPLGRPKRIVFAVQSMVPRKKYEREYILFKLADYAMRHPHVEVLIKPRSTPETVSTHTEKFYYQQLLADNNLQFIPNLKVVYGFMPDILKCSDLCISVSSTAVIEALAYGCRGAIISDFGVKESLGNQIFVSSGLYMPLEDLDRPLHWPQPNIAWLEENGLGGLEEWKALEDRLLALYSQQEKQTWPPLSLPERIDILKVTKAMKVTMRVKESRLKMLFKRFFRLLRHIPKLFHNVKSKL